MFKRPPIRYAGRFEFALQNVGHFTPPKKSIFNDKERLANIVEPGDSQTPGKKDEDKEEAEDAGNDDDSSAYSPSIQAIAELRSPKSQYKSSSRPNTTTKRVGRIQFRGIIVPPSAPKDLICEECEKRTASLFCGACRQVFCVTCADLAHPRVSHNDLMHAHEKEGYIRAIQCGDTSKIVKEDIFYLPDEELQMEDYNKIKDLSKPNALSTGTEAKKLMRTPALPAHLGPSGQRHFTVNDMVLFKDPITGRDAYGQVLSEWDERHGTAATPAILRGENSCVYYIVQKHGLLIDVEQLIDLCPGLEEELDQQKYDGYNNASSAASTTSDRTSKGDSVRISPSLSPTRGILTEQPDSGEVPLRRVYVLAQSINKRLRDLNNILAMGPKYHLRDLRDPKHLYAQRQAVLAHADVHMSSSETLDNDHTFSHEDASQITSTVRTVSPQRTSQLLLRKEEMTVTSMYTHTHPDIPNQMPYQRGHRKALTVLQRYDADSLQQQARLHEEARINLHKELLHRLDLNLYADVDGDAQSLLSHFNPHYQPLPAPQRSYVDILEAQRQIPLETHNRALESRAVRYQQQQQSFHDQHTQHNRDGNASHHSSGSSSDGSHQPAPQELVPRRHQHLPNSGDEGAWSSFFVLGEGSMKLLREYVAEIESRKRSLLTRIFSRQDYLWMKIQLQRKFRFWKQSLAELKVRRFHFLARKIQCAVRRWLCRDKLNELRSFWAARYEAKRRVVHAQFRFGRRGDKYAVTYDNKRFFATHTDMNRYAAFLARMLARLARYTHRKRLRLLDQAMHVWRAAIYDFGESTLQNEHIDARLVALDDARQINVRGVFSIDQEQATAAQFFQALWTQAQNLTGTNHLATTLAAAETGDAASVSITTQQLEWQAQQESTWYDENHPLSVSKWPLRFEPPLSFFNPDLPKTAASESNGPWHTIVPPYDPALLMQNKLPALPRLILPGPNSSILSNTSAAEIVSNLPRPASSSSLKNRLQTDLSRAAATSTTSAIPSATTKLEGAETTTTASPVVSTVSRPLSPTKNPNPYPINSALAGLTAHSYWMMPGVVLVGDAPFGPADVKAWKHVPSFDVFRDKGIFHDEPFPIELQYPYESGCNGFLADADVALVGGVTLQKLQKHKAKQLREQYMRSRPQGRKAEVLSAVTQLLLAGVNTFVSVLSEEEEEAVGTYYRSAHIEHLLAEALHNAQRTAQRVIVDNQSIIAAQTTHLEKIPHFGKTDPRYPAAFREKLRCQARIALAEANIHKMRKQTQHIPRNGVRFHRLPLMQLREEKWKKHKENLKQSRPDYVPTPEDKDRVLHAPWSLDEVLPTLWQLEQLIADALNPPATVFAAAPSREKDSEYSNDQPNNVPTIHSHVPSKAQLPPQKGLIYLYGGGLGCALDGPSRDGRAGLLMSMVLGRIYHLTPQEVLLRWQQAHDAMPALRHLRPLTPPSIMSSNNSIMRNFQTPVQTETGKAADAMEIDKDQKSSSVRASSAHVHFQTPCPPLPWQKVLLTTLLQRSHLPLDYPIIRAQVEPDRFTDLYREHYDEGLRYQVATVEAALAQSLAEESDRVQAEALAEEAKHEEKGVRALQKRFALQQKQQQQQQAIQQRQQQQQQAFKVPGIKIRGDVSAEEEEGVYEAEPGGERYSAAFVEAERQEAILRSATLRMKPSAHFHHELVWPPPQKLPEPLNLHSVSAQNVLESGALSQRSDASSRSSRREIRMESRKRKSQLQQQKRLSAKT